MPGRYQDYRKVETAITSVESTVGRVMMNLDEAQLNNVKNALYNARKQLDMAKIYNLNQNDKRDPSAAFNRLSYSIKST